MSTAGRGALVMDVHGCSTTPLACVPPSSFMRFWRVYSDVTHRRLHRQLEAVGFSLTAVASAAVVVAFWSPPHELEIWLAAGGNAHLSASRYFYMYRCSRTQAR